MENKKLLKFLLNDLSELDELVSEKGSNGFDELEMEFMHTRIKGVKQLIQILYDRESSPQSEVVQQQKVEDKIVEPTEEKIIAAGGAVKNEAQKEVEEKGFQAEEITEDLVAEIVEENEKIVTIEPENKIQYDNKIDGPIEGAEEKIDGVQENLDETNVELNEEEVVDEALNRLGDSFTKEKSVNDLMGTDNSNLEHKLSNRPVANIQAAIGINDRFQYIRELFDGKAEAFSNAVVDLDSKKDIKEAVEYLQQNFKWKKNETSLKFINLVKRRFSHE
ncbi:MAG: hypothetical protein L3J11_07190 [Draconibacterium sp.]|nr:hypothetical protein [Draconibacterium sp.]